MGWAQPIFFWRDDFRRLTMRLWPNCSSGRFPRWGTSWSIGRCLPGAGSSACSSTSRRASTVEDCARVSNHLTRLFAVENVDFERLEVSSPGLDRPLRKAADFVRFAGEEAELKLANPIANARKLKGMLRGCEGGAVVVETAKGAVTVPLADIDRARLVPKIEWRKAR